MELLYTPRQEALRFRNTLDFLEEMGQLTKEVKHDLITYDDKYMEPKKEYYAWIGINPSGETMTSLHIAASALPYKDYIYCVEQNTDNGIRPHIHLLAKVNSNVRPNKEIERLATIFKTQKNYIEFKISNSPSKRISRMKYIRGEKTHAKLINVEKDIKDRQIEKLENYYIVGNI